MNSVLKNKRYLIPGVIAIAGLLLVLSVFFYKFIVFGLIPLNGEWLCGEFNPWKATASVSGFHFNNDVDPVLYMYPIKYAAINMMKNGIAPTWNPYILSGVPLWGNNFSTPLNPLNFVFFIFDFMKAWGFFFIMQFAVAGIGMYLFCVYRGMKELSASVAALAYMLNTSFTIWFQTIGYVGVMSWLPLVFFLTERAVRRKSFLAAFWCGASYALFFFSGIIQMAVYAALFAFAYLLFRYCQEIFNETVSIKKSVALISFTIIIASIFSFPELLMQFTNILSSTRTPNRYGLSILYPQMLISYLSPHFFGTKYDGWDLGFGSYIFNRGYGRLSPPYIGILPLFFAVIGFFERKNLDRIFFLIFSVGILTALMFIAFPFIINPITKLIPIFCSVDHYRLTALYIFSVSVMAGWGLEIVTSTRNNVRIVAYITVAVSIIILAIFLCLQVLSIVGPGECFKAWIGGLEKAGSSVIFTGSHNLKSIVKFMEYLDILNKDNTLLIFSQEVFVPIIFVIVSVFLIAFIQSSKRKSVAGCAIFLFVAFDLLYYNINYPAYSKPSSIYPTTSSAEFIAKDPSLFRVGGYALSSTSPYGDVYPPNTGMIYGLYDIRGYENIGQPKWLYRFMMGDRPDEIVIARLNKFNDKFLPFLNVKYVLSDAPLQLREGWKLVYDKDIMIYENGIYRPRAFFADKVLFAKDDEEAYRIMQDSSFDVSTQVVLTADADDVGTILSDEHEYSLEISSYRPNEVILESSRKGSGILVMSDTFFPGWRVFVDGKERDIYKANYAFKAVVVRAGEKKIRFVFRPRYLYESLCVCSVLLVIAISLSIINISRSINPGAAN